MKKLLLMLMLLCTSFLGAWAVDWSTIDYLGSSVGEAYANKYKVESVTGIQNIANVQRPVFGTDDGIFLGFVNADFGELRIDGNKISYDKEGAGVLMHLSSFTKQESEVQVMNSGNTDVLWTFHVYYADGTTGGDITPTYSEYCGEVVTGQTITTTWETLSNGNILVTIGDGTGATNAVFRNGGFEGGLGGFTVLSGDGFATSEPGSTYFSGSSFEGKEFTLIKKADAVLPSPAKIQFTTNALAWATDENVGAYCYPTFVYTYGSLCEKHNDIKSLQNVVVDLSAGSYVLTSGVDYSTSSGGALSFSSSNEGVATIADDGTITPVAVGTTTITIRQAANATYVYGKTTLTVTVSDNSYGPLVAPTAPTVSAEKVRSIYSNLYTSNIEDTYLTNNWGSSPLTETRSIDGTDCRIYKMTGAVVIWGSNTTDDNSIRGKDGYRSGENTGLDVSSMNTMHVDVWCSSSRTPTFFVNDSNRGTLGQTTANGWTSFEIPLAGMDAGDAKNVRWLKFDSFAADDVVAIANVYFYTADPTLVETITISAPGSATEVAQGGTLQLTANVTPDNADNKTVTWSTTDNAGVTVNLTTGLVTVANDAEVNSTATITATATDDSGKYGNYVVTVKAATPDPEPGDDGVTLTNGGNSITYYAYYKGEGNYEFTVVSHNADISTTAPFSGSYWNVNGAGTSMNDGTVSVDGKTATITVNSSSDPNIYTPLYINMPGEVNYGYLTVNWINKSSEDREAPVFVGEPAVTNITATGATITVTGTDNQNLNIRVLNGDAELKKLENVTSGEEQTIEVTGLTADTNYTLTVELSDAANHKTTKNVQFKTLEIPLVTTGPQEAPADPTVDAAKVKAIYSSTYGADCNFANWSGKATYTKELYGKKFETNAPGYFGIEGFGDLNCQTMQTFHADIWAEEDLSVDIVPIHGGAEQAVTVNVEGGKWNSFDISLDEGNWDKVTNWSKVYQVKFANAENATFWLNNIYFYRTEDVAVEGISLPATEKMYFGTTKTLTATFTPKRPTNNGISWSSSNPEFAEINATTGLITAKAAGTTTITVTTAEGAKTASCALTVLDADRPTKANPATVEMSDCGLKMTYYVSNDGGKPTIHFVNYENTRGVTGMVIADTYPLKTLDQTPAAGSVVSTTYHFASTLGDHWVPLVFYMPEADNQAPTQPVVVAGSVKPGVNNISFTVTSTDNSGDLMYEVYDEGDNLLLKSSLFGTGVKAGLNAIGLTANSNHTLTVYAVDATGNKSVGTTVSEKTITGTELFTEDVKTNADVDHTFFMTGNRWADQAVVEETQSSATYDKTNGTLTAYIVPSKTEQWHGQVFLNTGITYTKGNEYDLSFTVTSTKELKGLTVKLDDKAGIVFDTNAQVGGKVSDNNYVYTFHAVNYPNTQGAGNGLMVFDFAPCDANTNITISNISIIEHAATNPISFSGTSDSAIIPLQSAGTGDKEGYKLVWKDDFEDNYLHTTHWTIEDNGDGGGNNELQYYSAAGVSVQNGNLALTGMRKPYGGKEFLSGRVNSMGKLSFKYGKVEARIKLPKLANGLWPAYWMMGNDFPAVGWPACGELDILEMGNIGGINAGTQEKFLNGAIHYGAAGTHKQVATGSDQSVWDGTNGKGTSPSTWGTDLTGEYHVFTMDWTQDRVFCYIDNDPNKIYFDVALDADKAEFFNSHSYLLFNLAIGGDFTGIHDPNNITAIGAAEGDYESMFIDYVRVWQKVDNVVEADPTKEITVTNGRPYFDDQRYYVFELGNTTMYDETKTGDLYNGLGTKEVIDLRPDEHSYTMDLYKEDYGDKNVVFVENTSREETQADIYGHAGEGMALDANSTWGGLAYKLNFKTDLSGIDRNYKFHIDVKTNIQQDIKVTLKGAGAATITIPYKKDGADGYDLSDGNWHGVDIPLIMFYTKGLFYDDATAVSGSAVILGTGGNKANGEYFDYTGVYIHGPATESEGYILRPEKRLLTKDETTKLILTDLDGNNVQADSWEVTPAAGVVSGTRGNYKYTVNNAIPVTVTAIIGDKKVMTNLDAYIEADLDGVKVSTTKPEFGPYKYYVLQLDDVTFNANTNEKDLQKIAASIVDLRNDVGVGGWSADWNANLPIIAKVDPAKEQNIYGVNYNYASDKYSFGTYAVDPGQTWDWGGISTAATAAAGVDLSGITDDYTLHIDIATNKGGEMPLTLNGLGSAQVKLGVPGSTSTEDIEYGRDNQWYAIDIPMSVFNAQGMTFAGLTKYIGTIIDLNTGALLNGNNVSIGGIYFYGPEEHITPEPVVELKPSDITNTTAVINIPVQDAATVVTVTYNWINPKTGVEEEHTHSSTTTAGQPYYMPVFNLKPNSDQNISVKIGENAAVPVEFKTLIHQSTDVAPANARGELFVEEPIPFVDYEPTTESDGKWIYQDVTNYKGKDNDGVYSYTLPVAAPYQWMAQFRKNLSYIDKDKDGNPEEVVSLYDDFNYDIIYTIESSEIINLSTTVESSKTACRENDGKTSIVNYQNVTLNEENDDPVAVADGYKYKKTITVRNEPGKDIPGAILVIDAAPNPANTNIRISNVHVIEKAKKSDNDPIIYNDVIYISTADELQQFAKNVNSTDPTDAWYQNATVYLLNSIDTKDITGDDKTYDGVGTLTNTFKGTFTSVVSREDHTPTNHTITLTDATNGVFNIVDGAKITGVTTAGTITAGAQSNVGGIVGIASGNTTITDCHNKADITAVKDGDNTGFNVGGIVGYVTGSDNKIIIDYAVNTGNITGAAKVGGIIGRVEREDETTGTINVLMSSVLNEGNITATAKTIGDVAVADANASGIIGCATNSEIKAVNAGNAGNVSGGTNQTAAFAGWIDGSAKFINSYNSGVITNMEANKNLYRISDAGAENVTLTNVYDASTTENKTQGNLSISNANDGTLKTALTTGDYASLKKAHTDEETARPWVQTIGTDPHPVFVAGPEPLVTLKVTDITNTTAVLNIPAQEQNTPVKVVYTWVKPSVQPTEGKTFETETHTQVSTTTAGQPYYMPLYNLQPNVEHTVEVYFNDVKQPDQVFTTLIHQPVETAPTSARGELMQEEPIPFIDFEPNWQYKDVTNYVGKDNGGVYSFTLPEATYEQWQAQFRKNLKFINKDSDPEPEQVTSIYDEYNYNLSFTVKSSEKVPLTASIESSETAWRNYDGLTSIIKYNFGVLETPNTGSDSDIYPYKYKYIVQNYPGKDIPGAILVVDFGKNAAGTNVEISDIHVEEIDKNDGPTIIDGHTYDLTAAKKDVTNSTVTLGLNTEGTNGQPVIYTITTTDPNTHQTYTWTTSGVGEKETSFIATGLNKNTTYTFNVKAQLEDGTYVGPSAGKNVEATTLNYDYVYTGMLFADNHKNDDYGKENGTENRNSFTNDRYTGAWSDIPNAAGKTGVTEIPYVIGYAVTVNPDNSITISGGIDADVAKITGIVAPTIWLDTDGDSHMDKEVARAEGNPDAFTQTYPAVDGQMPFNPEVTRVDFRFPFTDGGFINTGYIAAKETRGDLSLKAGVVSTTETTATIYMNGENGTSETVTYTIYRGEYGTPDAAAESGSLVATTTGSAGHNTNYTFTGLYPDTEYTYTVVVTDGGGQKKSQVVKPRTIPVRLDEVEFDNTVDGTAKYVWLNGTNSSDRQEVPYTHQFNLTLNENGTLTVVGGIKAQGSNTKNVADAVGLVLPHVFIKKATVPTGATTTIDEGFIDAQAPAGNPTEFYYTTTTEPGKPEYAKGDVIEIKTKYEYNGINGESQCTTATERFIIDEDGYARHYFNEYYKNQAEYVATSKKVRMYRTLRDGNWNTFSVPFNMSLDELNSVLAKHPGGLTADVQELCGLEASGVHYTMKFKPVEDGELIAGMPYFIKMSGTDDKGTRTIDLFDFASSETRPTFELNTTKPSVVSYSANNKQDWINFHAQYTYEDVLPYGTYIINLSSIYFVNSNVKMRGFRGWFTTENELEGDNTDTTAKKSIVYQFIEDDDDDIVTYIDVNGELVPAVDDSKPVYNVNGQRVSSAAKGILIQNGRKFVNK